MTTAEILAEIPNLSPKDRRRILERILEMEDEVEALETARRTADEGFQMLDAMEAQVILSETLRRKGPEAWASVDAIYDRLAASGRTFSDSADLLREDRDR